MKALLLQMMDFGYRALILSDPKDEYQLLCRALDVEPFRIGPACRLASSAVLRSLGDGWNQLNAKEAQSCAAIVFGRWLTVVRGFDRLVGVGEGLLGGCSTVCTSYSCSQLRMI